MYHKCHAILYHHNTTIHNYNLQSLYPLKWLQNVYLITKLFLIEHKLINSPKSLNTTLHLFLIFVFKCKIWFFGSYTNQITKIMFGDVMRTLVVIVQVFNTNIDGCV